MMCQTNGMVYVKEFTNLLVNKMKPVISIIIPVYNAEKYLRRCLDSVKNQTFVNWQAICVDDGATDKSGKILDEYADRDKRFVVFHIKNGGVSNARNFGIRKSIGQYVMFLDADDCIHPQTMDIVHGFAIKDNVDIVSFRYDKFLYKGVSYDINQYINNRYAKKYVFKNIHYKKTRNLIKFATEKNHSFGKFKIRHCYPVVHLYKRDLIKDIKFSKDIKISEDFPFWTTVLLKNPSSIIIRTPLYFYVQNDMSALHKAGSLNVFNNVSLAIMTALKEVKKNKPSKRWLKIWNREFLWPFVITCMRSVCEFTDKDSFSKRLCEMDNLGVFDNPPTIRARKYKHRIEKIISLIF